MPGFSVFPVTNILTSLILLMIIKASAPILTDFTFDLINEDDSFKLRPATVIFPISGRFIAPSPLIGNSWS